MNSIFDTVNQFFAGVKPITSFLWGFPSNYSWWNNIPILGQFSLVVLMLLGAGIYYTIKTRGVQFRYFIKGVKLIVNRKTVEIGISPFAAFMLGTAMRIGAGNIVGVTGAISIGGPGALFWMWLAALFGMATAFVEATLSQIYKEKNGNEYVGGLTHYGQKILGDMRWVGIFIGVVFIIYRMLSMPIHTFHVFVATASAIDVVFGTKTDYQSPLYYILALVIIISLIIIVFGGIRRVTSVTDKIVPVMAVGYVAIVVFLLFINFKEIPGFFVSVFGGVFKPGAIFGGAFGVALSQGIRRGLLSNEAGMGTVTMAAAASENNHPCEQGMIQSIGVFLDTIIICTMTGFVVVVGHIWTDGSLPWDTLRLDKIAVLMQSVAAISPGTTFAKIAELFIALSYGLFAFTTLLGGIIFCEISAMRISNNKTFVTVLRCLSTLVFVPFGAATVLSGLQLDNLWSISDALNAVLVLVNIPVILLGAKIALKALHDYEKHPGERFVSKNIGIDTSVWKEQK